MQCVSADPKDPLILYTVYDTAVQVRINLMAAFRFLQMNVGAHLLLVLAQIHGQDDCRACVLYVG